MTDVTTHVIGAGLSGLATAAFLVRAGRRVVVHEAAGHAGGRCRTYADAQIGRDIDNGNHLVLSGNRSLAAYLQLIGGDGELTGPDRAAFPFVDLATGRQWTVRPGPGRWPLWMFRASRRVPDSRWWQYLQAVLRLARADPGATVAGCLDDGSSLYRRFWEPLAVSALNTPADRAAASLLWPVILETFGRGEAACRPRLARRGLGRAFVEPAVAWLAARGMAVRFNARLRALQRQADRLTALDFADGTVVSLADGDRVVLAVPPASASALLPDLTVPTGSHAIANGHFLLPVKRAEPLFMGLLGGLAEWLFIRDDVASVTISAADRLSDTPAEQLAAALWQDVAAALGLGAPALPAWRIVREKRATFSQTPEQVTRRPPSRTRFANLLLAGDWIATGLPATLEGSVRSGQHAAAIICGEMA